MSGILLSDEYLAIAWTMIAYVAVTFACIGIRRLAAWRRHHLLSHHKLRALATRSVPVVGPHASCNAPTTGPDPHHRGSAVRSVEPLPAAGTSGSTPAAGPKPRTPVRLGSAAPRSCGPHPVVVADMAPTTGLSDRCFSRRGAVRSDPAAGARSPVAGPQEAADAGSPPDLAASAASQSRASGTAPARTAAW